MNIIRFIGIIILSVGVMFIFDARPIALKRFSFGDQNEGARILKIVGFIISIIGESMLIL